MLALLFPPSLGHIAASARADLLVQWFSRHMKVEVGIDVAPSYEALRDAIARREVDLAWAPPIICASVQEHCLAILKAVRGGRSMYRSAIVGRRGELRSLDDLRGKDAAWVDRLSTAGYLLPVAHLRAKGHDPDELFGSQSYLGSYGRALRAVLDREADTAAVYVRDATDEAVASTVVELLSESAPLRAVSFTAETPSDGLVVVERSPDSEVHRVLEPLHDLNGGRSHTMLLTIFDAESLELAGEHDYDELRHALH